MRSTYSRRTPPPPTPSLPMVPVNSVVRHIAQLIIVLLVSRQLLFGSGMSTAQVLEIKIVL